MTEQEASPESSELGYTGCAIHRAKRLRRSHAVATTGGVLSWNQAIAERQNKRDIVVCGDNGPHNMLIAQRIESIVTNRNHQYHAAHLACGKRALPHFQHRTDEDAGHTFYESPPDFVIANRGQSP